MSKGLINQVKSELEDKHGYDFDCEFWTDDIKALFQVVVETTQTVLENTI